MAVRLVYRLFPGSARIMMKSESKAKVSGYGEIWKAADAAGIGGRLGSRTGYVTHLAVTRNRTQVFENWALLPLQLS